MEEKIRNTNNHEFSHNPVTLKTSNENIVKTVNVNLDDHQVTDTKARKGVNQLVESRTKKPASLKAKQPGFILEEDKPASPEFSRKQVKRAPQGTSLEDTGPGK